MTGGSSFYTNTLFYSQPCHLQVPGAWLQDLQVPTSYVIRASAGGMSEIAHTSIWLEWVASLVSLRPTDSATQTLERR